LKKWSERLTWLLPISVCSLCLLANGAIAHAQLYAGRIVGDVSDPRHAVIPDATVIVTNAATNISETVWTGSSGDCVVTPLDPGIYDVSAAAKGFDTNVKKGTELKVGQAVEMDFALVEGTASTQGVVSSSGPALNTEPGAASDDLR
jgi:Carboxypeptidase regulatory-like domain